MEAKNANAIPLEEILAAYGRLKVRSYCGYDMYQSPFREESHPSFQVIHSSNTWKDFGTGEFGSAVDLVMKMEKCTFVQAMSVFDSGKLGQIPHNYTPPIKQPVSKPQPTKAIICKIAPLQNQILLHYLKEQRGIDPDIATCLCKEVYYKREGSDKNLFAVAFTNDSGGLEYRNGAGYKGCFINKDITTINRGSDQCAVFEGFMDFLTYHQMMKGKPDKLNIDFVILNSVAMVEKAVPFLEKHSLVNCFLDNDPAGRAAFSRINRLPITVINESRYLYPEKKDLNEFWVERLKRHCILSPVKDEAQPSYNRKEEPPGKRLKV